MLLDKLFHSIWRSLTICPPVKHWTLLKRKVHLCTYCSVYWSWAVLVDRVSTLLYRLFLVIALRCARCGGARNRTGYRVRVSARTVCPHQSAATVLPEHCVTFWLLSKACSYFFTLNHPPPRSSPRLLPSVISILLSLGLTLAFWSSLMSGVLSVNNCRQNIQYPVLLWEGEFEISSIACLLALQS